MIARLSEGKKVELNKAKIDAHLNKIKLITSLSSNYLKKKAGMISC